jgi:hypothetical protein
VAKPPNPDSLRQRAKAAGVEYGTVLARLRLGWTEADAFSRPTRHQERRNIAARARAAGISRTAVSNRLRRGWSLDRALSAPVAKPSLFQVVKRKRRQTRV